MLADLRRAVALLTILPLRDAAPAGRPYGRAMAYYSLIGAVIGGVLAGVTALLEWVGLTANVPLLTAALVLAAWAALTGGLHLDGWADCCDALFVPVDRQRRLEIMKDPHLGGFGVLGLVLLLLVKLAALTWVIGSEHALLALVAVPAVARWAAVVAARMFPSARPGGMGDTFRAGLGPVALAIATIIALAATAPLLWAGSLPWAVVVWGAVVIAFLALAFLAQARLGGLTGDVYGGVVEVGETAALVGLCFL